MTSADEITMHAEHNDAKYDHLLWLEDIERWRIERRRAAGMLASIATAWQAAEETLERHVEMIRTHQAHMLEHELAIVEHQRDDVDPTDERLAGEHNEFLTAHARERERHQQFRTQHEGMVSEIRELYRAANQMGLVPEGSPSLED